MSLPIEIRSATAEAVQKYYETQNITPVGLLAYDLDKKGSRLAYVVGTNLLGQGILG